MYATERDFVVPSLHGFTCSQNSNKDKMVFTEADKEKKLRSNSMEHCERSKQWLRG